MRFPFPATCLLAGICVGATTIQSRPAAVRLPTFQEIRDRGTFGGIRPVRYELELRILAQRQLFDGRLLLTFATGDRHVPAIFLNTNGIRLPPVSSRSYALKDRAKRDVPLIRERPEHYSAAQVIAIRPRRALPPNTRYYLQINGFNGILREGRSFGIFRGLAAKPDTFAIASQFQLNNARTAFPCVDQPRFKTPFKLTLVHQPDMLALSNTGHRRRRESGGEVSTEFEETPSLPTYTFALALLPRSHYDQLPARNSRRGVPITVHYNRSPCAGERRVVEAVVTERDARRYLSFAEYSLNELEAFFAPNPLTELHKVDLILLPEFYLQGMENFGMITLNQDYLLRTSPALQLSLIAHELAHMWFSNYVTVRGWDDLCIQEGLTDHFARGIVRSFYGEDSSDYVSYLLEKFLTALRVESKSSPAENLLLSFSPDIGQVSRKCFGKAVFIVDSLENLVGKAIFRDKVNAFVMRHANADYKLHDFTTHFATVYKDGSKSTGEVFDYWFSRGGMPTLTATKDTRRGAILLEQKQYQFGERFATHEAVWPVPLRARVESNNWSLPVAVMNTSRLELPAPRLRPDSWFFLNPSAGHFYRVNYDPTNWELLLEQMARNPRRFTPISRAQILSDLCFFLDKRLMFSRADWLKALVKRLVRRWPDRFPHHVWYTTKCG